jgi:hypothetical protein
MRKVLVSLLALASFGFSAINVAVLNTEVDTESAAAKEIEDSELRYITQEIRRQAINNLPKDKYRVMTEQSVQAQGEAILQECAEENCMVSLGEKIGADFITRGTLSKFRKKYTLTVEVYDTKNGMLTASSDPVENEDIEDLLGEFRKIAPAFFAKIGGGSRSNAISAVNEDAEKTSNSESSGVRFGLVGGIGTPSFGGDLSIDGSLAWSAGLISIWPIIPNGDLEASVLFSSYYGSNSDYGISVDFTVSGIDVPVLFRYHFGSFYGGAGVKIGIPLMAEFSADGESEDVGEALSIPEISIAIGSGWQLGSLLLSAKYFIPITDFMSEGGATASRSGLFFEAAFLF